MELLFRKGTLDDLEAITLLIHEAILHMEEQSIHQWDELYPTSDDFKADILASTLYVGILNGQLAVVYVLSQDYDAVYDTGNWQRPNETFYVIHRLCVSPHFQHQGIAKQTMAYIHKQTLSLGASSIRLDVYSQNPYALALYHACGYQKVGDAHWRKGHFYLMETYLK